MARTKHFDLPRFFQALGDNTRLRLLNLMGKQEVCVCYFVEILGAPQPKISRHLAYLRNAGIVSARREGKWMHYRIVMPPHLWASEILWQTLDSLKGEKTMQADRARLTKVAAHPRSTRLMVLRFRLLSVRSALGLADVHDGNSRPRVCAPALLVAKTDPYADRLVLGSRLLGSYRLGRALALG
jgi:ArsR family transcriptional regulator